MPALQIGVCNCRDNTAGPNCEKCSDGYYGDPTAGTASDCQPCPCPGGSSCAVVPTTQEVVCTNCPTGTTGESALSPCSWRPSFRNILRRRALEASGLFSSVFNDYSFPSRQHFVGNRLIIDLQNAYQILTIANIFMARYFPASLILRTLWGRFCYHPMFQLRKLRHRDTRLHDQACRLVIGRARISTQVFWLQRWWSLEYTPHTKTKTTWFLVCGAIILGFLI